MPPLPSRLATTAFCGWLPLVTLPPPPTNYALQSQEPPVTHGLKHNHTEILAGFFSKLQKMVQEDVGNCGKEGDTSIVRTHRVISFLENNHISIHQVLRDLFVALNMQNKFMKSQYQFLPTCLVDFSKYAIWSNGFAALGFLDGKVDFLDRRIGEGSFCRMLGDGFNGNICHSGPTVQQCFKVLFLSSLDRLIVFEEH